MTDNHPEDVQKLKTELGIYKSRLHFLLQGLNEVMSEQSLTMKLRQSKTGPLNERDRYIVSTVCSIVRTAVNGS